MKLRISKQSMSTLSRIVFAVCNTSRGVTRCRSTFSCQSFMSRWKHTDTGLADHDDLMFEDSVEESLNDPRTQYPKKVPGRQLSAKKQLEMQQRQFVKKKTIEKKLKKLYAEKQANLLTWAARAQIKHLNQIDPIYWTPEMLSKSFPATRDEIIKIIKSRRLPKDETEIYKHDKYVHNNWLKLKKVHENHQIEGGPIDPEFRQIIESGKLNLMKNAGGSSGLPIPDSKDMLLTQKQIAEQNTPVTSGEFSAILEDYKSDVAAVKVQAEIRHIKFKDKRVVKLLKNISVNDKKDPNDKSEAYENSVEHSDNSLDDSVEIRPTNSVHSDTQEWNNEIYDHAGSFDDRNTERFGNNQRFQGRNNERFDNNQRFQGRNNERFDNDRRFQDRNNERFNYDRRFQGRNNERFDNDQRFQGRNNERFDFDRRFQGRNNERFDNDRRNNERFDNDRRFQGRNKERFDND